MSKLLLFRRRQNREAAAYALALSARLERSRKTKPLLQPSKPEQLGNHLQLLTKKRPSLVLALENIVAEIVQQLDQ